MGTSTDGSYASAPVGIQSTAIGAVNTAPIQTLPTTNPNNQALGASFGAPIIPTTPPVTTLNASQIGNITPKVLPPTRIPTAGAALAGTIEGMTQSAKVAAAAPIVPVATPTQANTAQSKTAGYAEKLLAAYEKLTGKSTRQLQMNEEAKVDEKTKLVNDLTNQIDAKRLAIQRQTEALRGQGRGIPESVLNTQINEITRKGNMELADLAIQQNAANNDLLTATNIIKQKLDLEFEPEEIRLDALKAAYPIFKDEIDREDKDYEKKLDAEIEQVKDFKEFKQAAYNTLLSNGGGTDAQALNALGAATNEEEIALAIAKYGTDAQNLSTQVVEIGGKKLLIDSKTGETIRNLGSTVNIDPTSGYTEKQQKAITKINDSVSKNTTYAKTNSMRTFADNVIASLSQQTGVGDIAAINQFQKVIDEGAVTRDQDVVLIQGAQSLADQLKLKITKLQKGEQLSPTQRQEMRTLLDDLYNAQVRALMKDPYIKAKETEAKLNGITLTDTILGELGVLDRTGENNPNGFVTGPNQSQVYELNGKRYQAGPDGKYYEMK